MIFIEEIGHVAKHRFTNLIPDSQCDHCHHAHLARGMLIQGVRERAEIGGDKALGGDNPGTPDPRDVICGVASLVLVIGWAFTRHFAMADNASLWQTSPLSLVLALLIPRLLRGGDAARAHRWVPWSVAALAVVGALLELIPALHEHNAEIIALVLPVQVALARVLTRARATAAVAEPAPHEAVLLH